ncbi:MAG: protein tyrosine phosphatase family protein [Halioglobus sp.]
MAILNHFQVTDDIASSGQPTVEQFDEIALGGYDAIINLAMPDHKNSIANEGSLVTSLGMTYIHIPVPFDAPNEGHFAAFSGYMDALKDKKVWVHCIVNARVSAFLFRYLQINRSFTAAEATTPILEQWIPQMDNVWKQFISPAPKQL